MKTKSILLTALLGMLLSLGTSTQAAIGLLTRIVEISPAQAAAGQTITVRTESPNLSGITNSLAKLSIPQRFRRGVIPGAGSTGVKIFFTGADEQQTVEGQNLVSLGNNRYSVRVPGGARTGKLRFQRGLSSSLSTPTFTLVSTGYTFVNFSQFNVISIKIDNVERLGGQMLQATLPSNPNVFNIGIGATPGNHSLQVTVGRSLNEPVMVYALPSVAATSPFNEVHVGITMAGEYLTASPNAAVIGSNLTANWQTFIPGLNGSASVNGFDFTFNQATGLTTWRHWVGDRPNVVASGSVAEPASWPLNPATMTLALRHTNGSIFTNITVNFLTKSMFVNGDGRTYDLQ